MFAIKVPVDIAKFPLDEPSNVPVPTTNLSADSSNPINALFESPLSIIIPLSPAGAPVVPFPSSSNLSVTTVFVDAAVVEWNNPDPQQKILYMFYVGFSEFSNQGNYQAVFDSKLHIAISYDNGLTWEKDENNPVPIHRTSPASILSVDARVVGSRIHLWVGDMYNNVGGIGYFYYEPNIEPH